MSSKEDSGAPEDTDDMVELNENIDRFLDEVDTRLQYQRDFQSIEQRYQDILSDIDADATAFARTM